MRFGRVLWTVLWTVLLLRAAPAAAQTLVYDTFAQDPWTAAVSPLWTADGPAADAVATAVTFHADLSLVQAAVQVRFALRPDRPPAAFPQQLLFGRLDAYRGGVLPQDRIWTASLALTPVSPEHSSVYWLDFTDMVPLDVRDGQTLFFAVSLLSPFVTPYPALDGTTAWPEIGLLHTDTPVIGSSGGQLAALRDGAWTAAGAGDLDLRLWDAAGLAVGGDAALPVGEPLPLVLLLAGSGLFLLHRR